MKINDNRVVLISVFVMFLMVGIPLMFAATLDSPNLNFNTTPDLLRLNWTNNYQDNITIVLNDSITSEILQVQNSTSGAQSQTITRNYSQPLGSFTAGVCGNAATDPIETLIVTNSTGTGVLITISTEENVSFDASGLVACPVGRYKGLLNITNSSDTTEYTNSTFIIDIPITTTNTLNTTSGVGTFKGIIPANNTGEYHSYYFNTSELDASALLINLTWNDQDDEDIDVFLLDSSGNLKARGINSGISESFYFGYLPSNEMWEIRVYGNSTSTIDYTSSGGKLLFSTLNATNASATTQRFDLINLGDNNPSITNTVDVTLMNNGTLNYTSITETFELYHENIEASSTPGNFTIRVPDFTTKLEVDLNWTGDANYTLTLINTTHQTVDSSVNKHTNANISGVEHIEKVESDPSTTIGLNDDGEWIVNVTRNSGASGTFTITTRNYLDASTWIDSNFSATSGLNMTGLANDTNTFQFNLTTQNLTLSGLYKGDLIYTTNRGSVTKIPIQTNITTEELFVNNSFVNNTITIKENSGFNITRVLNVTVENPGNKNLTIEEHSNSSFLNKSTNYIDLLYDFPSTTIVPGGSATLNITLDIDTTETSDSTGLYTGWILLNDTSSAHPYNTFNLSLELNLTDSLDVFIRDINNATGGTEINTTSENNITLDVEVFYINGTEFVDDDPGPGGLGIENFTQVYLKEKNTSYIIPNTTGFTIKETINSASFHDSGVFKLNATIPANSSQIGGYYDFHIKATDVTGTDTLSGEILNGTLVILNEGLKIFNVGEPSGGDLKEDEEGTINVTIINYGTVDASEAKLNFTLEDSNIDNLEWIDGDSTCSADSASSDDVQVTFDISAGSTCYLVWNVTGASEGDADITLEATAGIWYGNASFDIEIDAKSSTTSETSSTTTSTTTSSSTTKHDVDITSFPTLTEVVQGQTKKVTIEIEENAGTNEKDIVLSVSGIKTTWFTAPTKFNLDSLKTAKKEIEFTIPANASVKEFSIIYNIKNSDIDESAAAKLKILPSNETIEKLNTNIKITEDDITKLEKDVKDFIKNLNETESNSTTTKLQQIKDKLQLAKAALEAQDYFTAASLLTEINELAELLRNDLGIEKKSSGNIVKTLLIIAASIVGIGVVGLITYMLLPPGETKSAVLTSKQPKGAPKLPNQKDSFVRKMFKKKKDEKYKFKPN